MSLHINLAGIPASWSDYSMAVRAMDDLTNADLHAILHVYESLTAASAIAFLGHFLAAYGILSCSTYSMALFFFMTAMFLMPAAFLYGAHQLGNSRNQQYAVLGMCLAMGCAAGQSSTSGHTAWPLLATSAACYAAARGTYYVKGAPRQRAVFFALVAVGVAVIATIFSIVITVSTTTKVLLLLCTVWAGVIASQLAIYFERRGVAHPINQSMFIVHTTMCLLWAMR